MKKALSLILTMCLLATVFCGLTVNASAADHYVIKFGLITEPDSLNVKCAENFKELIEAKSEGRIEVQIYPSSQLGDKTALMEGMRNGTVEMSDVSAVDMSSFNPRWSLFSFPYVFDTHQEILNVMHDETVEGMLNGDAEAAGFKIIAWWDVGARSMINSKHAVETPDDLVGLRLRVMQDKWLARAVELMGASPVVLNMSECYTAIQQGVLDAFENSPPLIADNGFHEVAKYYSATEHFRIPAVAFMSKSFFDSLPEDLQAAVIEAGVENEEFSKNLYAGHEAASLEKMEAAGVTITTVDKSLFKDKVQPMFEEFFAEADESAEELYNAFLNAMS